MGIFTNLAVSALMSTSHPGIDRRVCWNLRPHKDRCEDCMKICPKGLFTRPSIVKDWTACLDCGLCVSVCRARCIVPSGEQVEHDLAPLEKDKDKLWIGCERSARQNDVVRTCVGSLAWENLAYMALNKKLVLDLTPCADCDSEVCVEHVRQMLHRLVDFFGAPLFEARFTLATEAEDAPYESKEYNRREMMAHLTKGSKSSTRQLLKMIPGLRDESAGHAMDHRLLLHERTKQLKAASATPLHYGWYLPNVTDACYGCGKCEKGCRVGALKLVDGENGTTRIVVTPWKCSECGQCVTSCTEKAIDGMKLRQVTTLGPVSVHTLTKTLCPECKKPMKPDSPDGICHACAARRRMQKRREETAQRIRERKEKQQAAQAAAQAKAEAAAGTAAAAAAAPEKENPAPAAPKPETGAVHTAPAAGQPADTAAARPAVTEPAAPAAPQEPIPAAPDTAPAPEAKA